MYDFQWDVELDDQLFSLDPPEDYTLEERFDLQQYQTEILRQIIPKHKEAQDRLC